MKCNKEEIHLSDTSFEVFSMSKAVAITQKNSSYKNENGELITQQVILTFEMVAHLFEEVATISFGNNKKH